MSEILRVIMTLEFRKCPFRALGMLSKLQTMPRSLHLPRMSRILWLTLA